jgi:hypothetical protein
MSQTVLRFVGISWQYSSTFTLNYKNSQHKPEASRNFVFLAREEVAFILNFEQSRQTQRIRRTIKRSDWWSTAHIRARDIHFAF